MYSNWGSEICFKHKFQRKIHLSLPSIPYDTTPLHPKTLSQKYHIHLQGLSSSEEVRNLGIIRKLSFENIFIYHIQVTVSFPFFTWISTWSFKSVLLCFISIQQGDLFMGKALWFLFFLQCWGALKPGNLRLLSAFMLKHNDVGIIKLTLFFPLCFKKRGS